MLFRVKNYTRYRTEDLEAFLQSVENLIPALWGVTPQRAFIRRWEKVPPAHGRVGDEVAFKDFTSKKTTAIIGVGGGRIKRRNLVKIASVYQPNHAENEVRIQPPNRLWESDLERLAACGKDEPVVPSEMKLLLAMRLLQLYQGNVQALRTREVEARHHRQLETWSMSRLAPDIRIMAKRAAKVDTAEKHRVARHKAMRSWSVAGDEVNRLSFYLERVIHMNTTALNRLARSHVPLTAAEHEVGVLIAVASHAVLEAQRALSRLNSSGS